KVYTIDEAARTAKFDETVEVHAKLGIDPRRSDQNVRGTVSLPHGLGKQVRVLAIAKGEKIKEAEEAGADYVGGEEIIQKILDGWMDFVMGAVGSKLGRILGPRGLNPKAGTVGFNIGEIIREIKAGRIEFRNDKTGAIHAPVGKASFPPEKLADNIRAFIRALEAHKPEGAKGTFLRSVYVTTTMGPSVRI
uniref:50S ribosomal protein L1 n=1 Tax=Thermus thermophilus TaxID=274 RepID=UPI000194ECA9|nr:Chain BC, 50S ribosomal protein L1 [Thermus thermophilus]